MTTKIVVTDEQLGRPVIKIISLLQLCDQKNPTFGQLIQLANETKTCVLLGQFDALRSDQRAKIRPLTIQLWADEEIESDYSCPEGYGYPENWVPKNWEMQIRILKGHWNQLDYSHVGNLINQLGSCPKGTDGRPYIIPKPYQYFIKYLVKDKDRKPNLKEFYAVDEDGNFINPFYGQALEKILETLGEVRSDFYNYRKGKLSPKYLRLTEKIRQAYLKMEIKAGDFFVLWGQLGLRHKGRSIRRARIMFENNEYGLCPFAIVSILITHPDRLTKYEHLTIDCAGCEYSADAAVYCLGFSFGGTSFYLGGRWVAGAGFGSASAVFGE